MTVITDERLKTHGPWRTTSAVAQALKRILRVNADKRTDSQNEALDAVATKLSRIISGDAAFPDHWADIMGYADLAIQTGAAK